MKNSLFFCCAFFLLIACEQKHYFNQYKSVDIKAWKSTDTISFPIEIKEENKKYQYSISIRHTKDFEFSNLWVKVLIKGNKIDTSFRYEIPLFKIDGKPYGESSGSLCTQTIPLKTDLPLYQKGNYQISIIQLMRKDPLDGISDVGIFIDTK